MASGPTAGPRAQVRLRAFRDPEEELEFVRDAALAQAGSGVGTATPLGEAGPDAWLVEREEEWVYVAADHARQFAVVLGCGKAVCRTREQAAQLAITTQGRVEIAAGDRSRMVELLGPKDVDGLPEIPVAQPELYEFDEVRLEATVKDQAHSLALEAWLEPPAGIEAKVAAVRDTIGGLSPDDSVAQGGQYGEIEGAHTCVFGVPETDVVVRLTCHAGLCGDRARAQAVAQRAATTALDASTFVDAQAERARPFVPRGNVKGRAERIWLPLARFWLPIR